MANQNPYHVRLAISQYRGQFRAELFTEDLGDTTGKLLPALSTVDIQLSGKTMDEKARFKFTEASFQELRDDGVPDDIVERLEDGLETQTFFSKAGLDDLLEKNQFAAEYKNLIVKHATQVITLRQLVETYLREESQNVPCSLQELGLTLFKNIFGEGDNSRKWEQILKKQSPERPIRLLLDTATDDVWDLPYGLLWDPEGKSYLFLPKGGHLKIQYVRIIRRFPPRLLTLFQKIKAKEKVKVLVAAAEPGNVIHVKAKKYAEQLVEELSGSGVFEVSCCYSVRSEKNLEYCHLTLPDIERSLDQKFDILHLIAHGYADKEKNVGGVLLCQKDGSKYEIPANDFAAICKGKLQIAFLQVCHASETGGRGGFGGLAEQLLDPTSGDLAAVVASLYPVRIAESTMVAKDFYRRIADNEIPDAALTMARGTLGETAWPGAFLELWVRPGTLPDTGTFGNFQFPRPYRGLARFEERDREIFYGRDAEIYDLLKIMSAETVVAIVGDSGSGKSSLLQAGVCARVRRDGLLNQTDWRIISLSPGAMPAKNLLLALGGQTPDLFWNVALQQAFAQIRQMVQPFLLVFDQFEELFTLCDNPAERQAISTMLAEAVRQPSNRFRLILGMRSEYLGAVATLPGLNELITRPWVLKFPDAKNVRAMIEQPATYHGYTFETGLLDTILTDPLLTPGAAPLPLLEFALERLWLKAVECGSQEFTMSHYTDIGGLSGAIAHHADEVYDDLSRRFHDAGDAARRMAETILSVELVTTNMISGELKHTRQPRPRKELEKETNNPELARKVIDRLVGERLLTLRRNPNNLDDALVDLAHEVLLTRWEKLQEWLVLDSDERIMKKALQKDLEKWNLGMPDVSARSPQLLPKPEVAKEYLNWVDSRHGWSGNPPPTLGSDLQKEFVKTLREMLRLEAEAEAKRRRQEEEQRQRELEAAQKLAQEADARRVAEEHARHEADQRAEETRALLAKNYWRNAVNARKIGDWLESIHFLALAAQKESTLSQQVRSARFSIQHDAKSVFLLNQWDSPGDYATFSSDGRFAFIWSYSGGARLCHIANGASVMEYQGRVDNARFSSDGKLLLIWHGQSDHEMIHLWQITDGPSGLAVRQLPEQIIPGKVIICSPDGNKLLIRGKETIQLWQITNDSPPLQILMEQGGPGGSGTFSPDSRLLLTWAAGKREVRLWDSVNRTSHVLTIPIEGGFEYTKAAFAPDGKTILTWEDQGDLKLWSINDDSTVRHSFSKKYEKGVVGATFSSDGQQILSWSRDGTLRLWRLMQPHSPAGSPEPPEVVLMKHEGLAHASFSSDDHLILSWSDDGMARLWHAADGSLAILPMKHGGAVQTAIFNQERRLIFTWSAGVMRSWQMLQDNPRAVQISEYRQEGKNTTPWLREHKISAKGAIFSQDESQILTWDENDIARLWWTKDGSFAAPPMKPGQAVKGAAFSQDGELILTWGSGWIQLWHKFGFLAVLPMIHEGDISAAFSQDERSILTWDWDKTARLWDISVDYDFPQKHLLLLVEVVTGTTMDDLGNVTALSPEAWQQKRVEYIERAEEHLKTCQYQDANIYLKQKSMWMTTNSDNF